MNRDMLPSKGVLVSLLVLIALSVTGCVTVAPIISVAPEAKLDTYEKVYVVEAKKDPQKVGSRISERLKQTGFQVVEIKPGSLPKELQGTGFIITPAGHVLTCAHVVGNQTNATTWIGGQRYACDVISTDTNLDLALLLVKGEHPPFMPLIIESNPHYSLGEDAFCMGFPLAEILGSSPRLNKGMISATVGLEDDPKYVQFSAPIQPGNSGGPLLTAKGKVIGVICSTLNPLKVMVNSGGDLPQNVNFALKADSLHQFLAAAKITLPAEGDKAADTSFDEAQKSLSLVRSGNVTDGELKQRALLCLYNYISIYNLGSRFGMIEVWFYDHKTGELVLKAGRYRDDPFSTEDEELDDLFAKISGSFFPQRPNPFKNIK